MKSLPVLHKNRQLLLLCFRRLTGASLLLSFLVLLSNNVIAQNVITQGVRESHSAILDKKIRETAAGTITTGRFQVYENRTTNVGRKIHLNFVILHAQKENPKSDPFFFIVGGPGQAATSTRTMWTNHWIRKNRDVVLIDQRGTGGDNRLQFQFKTKDDANEGSQTLQQFMSWPWDENSIKSNLKRLSKKFDLRMYSTQMAADDLNDFRQAMGYDKINISGGSYGTRASLIYIRRHGETVRTAMLAGCAPIEFRNPLYHAKGAQRCIDQIFDEVDSNEKYRNSFGDLKKKFESILRRLDSAPAKVSITNEGTGKSEPVTMNREQFCSAVRLQTYYTQNSRRVPALICEAHEGNFRPFVLNALRQNIALRQSLAMGMLMSVTTAEDLDRIEDSEIESLTKNTYLGSSRVLAQMKAGKIWPKSELDSDYGKPVKSNVETLILSGNIDPVTPPRWGELVHKNFPNSIHVVVPSAHNIGGPCVEKMQREFLANGIAKKIDTSCVKRMALPPFVLPKQ